MLDMEGTPIKVGDWVGWKDDIETSGQVIDNRGPYVEVRVWDSITGSHETRMVSPRRCWHE